jgi:hypothetical protein
MLDRGLICLYHQQVQQQDVIGADISQSWNLNGICKCTIWIDVHILKRLDH